MIGIGLRHVTMVTIRRHQWVHSRKTSLVSMMFWATSGNGRRTVGMRATPVRLGPVGPGKRGDCGLRVLRGGSWVNSPRNLRTASRSGVTSGIRDDLIGFRVARTLD